MWARQACVCGAIYHVMALMKCIGIHCVLPLASARCYYTHIYIYISPESFCVRSPSLAAFVCTRLVACCHFVADTIPNSKMGHEWDPFIPTMDPIAQEAIRSTSRHPYTYKCGAVAEWTEDWHKYNGFSQLRFLF